jgi:hypothetical protein
MLALYILAALAILALFVKVAESFGKVYFKYRGDRVITCPENQRPAGVHLDLGHALLSPVGPDADLRLKSCSRWPERQDCGQQCLQQIEAAPADCLVRNILTQWYQGKNCAVCGKPCGEIQWAEHKPALMSPSHTTVQWWEVPPEKVPDVLRTHRAVCWNCHVVNKMMNEHPDLVLDRSRSV